jgi:acyl carrier protein
MDITHKVKEIVAEQLDVEMAKITDDARFVEDLGADSLAIVEIVLAFEEAFGVDIPDEVTEKMVSVGDVIAYVQKHAA